jgi:predicted metal-dependent phosphoesterase TrpH
MEELITNLHMHTPYSDGHGSHHDIAQAALKTGLDVVITTDHNVLVNGFDGYYQEGQHKVLMLVSEEVHDQARQPQKNHMLVVGANRELATFAPDPQNLIDQVKLAGGLSFLAHPIDPALPLFHEDDLSWVSWDIHGFTGIELWNGFSEFKSVIHSYLHGFWFAFFPESIARGPFPKTLQLWDSLLAKGERVVAVGGSDAHALPMKLGPFHRTIFPYEYHFQCVNNHLLTPTSLSGDLPADRRMVLQALQQGHTFVGYDLPASTKGFRFSATTEDKTAIMGDELEFDNGVTLQFRLPRQAECRLIKDGAVIQEWTGKEAGTYITKDSGVYRVEAYIEFLGRRRGWIFSNPIYIRKAR